MATVSCQEDWVRFPDKSCLQKNNHYAVTDKNTLIHNTKWFPLYKHELENEPAEVYLYLIYMSYNRNNIATGHYTTDFFNVWECMVDARYT